MTVRALVALVDDDESIRESVPELLEEFGFEVQVFASAEKFLAARFLEQAELLVLDVAMPGMTGPMLQQELKRQGRFIPIIFITAHADKELCSQLIAAGAVDCLFKPFAEAALLQAIRKTHLQA